MADEHIHGGTWVSDMAVKRNSGDDEMWPAVEPSMTPTCNAVPGTWSFGG